MKSISFLIVSLGLGLAGNISHAQDSTSFKIIVNVSNPVSSLTKEQISRLFLKKVTRWDDNLTVLPADLNKTSPVRHSFSKKIHGRTVAAIDTYWRVKIFSGRETPPPEKTSDQAVIDHVQENPGAIGYISAVATVGGKVKVVNSIK